METENRTGKKLPATGLHTLGRLLHAEQSSDRMSSEFCSCTTYLLLAGMNCFSRLYLQFTGLGGLT